MVFLFNYGHVYWINLEILRLTLNEYFTATLLSGRWKLCNLTVLDLIAETD